MASYSASFWCARHDRIEHRDIPLPSDGGAVLLAIEQSGRIALRLVSENEKAAALDQHKYAAVFAPRFSTVESALQELNDAQRLIEHSRARLAALGILMALNDTVDPSNTRAAQREYASAGVA